MSKPEHLRVIAETCNDCAFLDVCPAEGECIRAAMARLGIEANTPIDEARRMIRAADTAIVTADSGMSAMPPSAIIEPPTKAELERYRQPYEAVMDEVQKTPAPIPILAAMICRAAGQYERQTIRAQIRAAIDEISKAQKQIVPALELCGASVDAVEADRRERTSAAVLEALPEAVAHRFGLTIRGACAECGTTLFREEPYTSNAAGQPTCEAHADPEAA